MTFAERYCASCGAANPPDAAVCFACRLSLKITAALHDGDDVQALPLLQQRYRILAQVGKGGFSAVYRAEDTHYANHPVAIKAITLSGLKPSEVIEATEAFNREVLLLSGLKHPNLPQIYAHFSTAECWYLVMDFIEGTTLEKHLEKIPGGQIPLGEVFEIGLLLCDVLAYLHSRQPTIVFRDLKPANIMVTSGGRVCLIDFGIARHFKPGQAKDTLPFGSPGYAAPEQYGKAQSTPRTDIYGLGVTLHQLISGDDPSQTPFRFASLALADDPTLADLERLIMRMVEMDMERRPATVEEVRQDLERIARAWGTRHNYGLSARTAYQGNGATPSPTFTGKSSSFIGKGTGAATTAHGMSMNQLSYAPQSNTSFGLPPPSFTTGAGSYSNAYYTPPGTRRWNGMAVASLALGILSIFAPFFLCASSSLLSNAYYGGASRFLFILPLFVFMVVPSICAVIFGHIGKRRAITIPGLLGSKDIASTGMVIGYIFSSIYLGFFCILVMIFTSFR